MPAKLPTTWPFGKYADLDQAAIRLQLPHWSASSVDRDLLGKRGKAVIVWQRLDGRVHTFEKASGVAIGDDDWALQLEAIDGDSPMHFEVEIGSETWHFTIEGHYTHIYEEGGEFDPAPIVLRWIVKSEDEVRAAAYAFCAGRRLGVKQGRMEKAFELKSAVDKFFAEIQPGGGGE